MIDRVISFIVVFFIVVFASFALYVSVFSGLSAQQTLTRQGYEQDQGRLLIASLLQAHENDSRLTYEALLSKALRELNTTVLVNGESIDVEAEFAEALDAMLGPDGYYFTIAPALQGVSVSYVLDGSPTMRPAREELNTSLPSLISRLQGLFGRDAKIFTHIYILADPQDHPCSQFSYSVDEVSCTPLSGQPFYEGLMLRGYSPPIIAPFRTFSEWLYDEHPDYLPKLLSGSDWGSASTYASLAYAQDATEQVQTNKHVIVTLVDELTSTSKADSCFSLDDPADFLICSLCNSTCPETRAEGVINQTVETLKRNGDLFIGFYDFRCDYVYDTSLNNYPLTNETRKYVDAVTPSPGGGIQPPRPIFTGDVVLRPPGNIPGDGSGGPMPANVNWCDQDACGGCTSDLPVGSLAMPPSPGRYCFHRNCDQMIVHDLTRLANATGGKVLGLDNLRQLTDVVYDYFNQSISSFNFTLGERHEERQRYVVRQRIMLASGEPIDVTFWVYD